MSGFREIGAEFADAETIKAPAKTLATMAFIHPAPPTSVPKRGMAL
jgi:hypothetical protein